MIEKITSFALIIMYLIIIYKISVFVDKYFTRLFKKLKDNKKKED